MQSAISAMGGLPRDMYTVKQVVAMTGLTAATLRIWERRYGVVNPRRTAGHYRMFSEADVARLRVMVQLIEAGATAGRAADLVMNDPSLSPTPAPDPPSHEPDALSALAGRFDIEGITRLLTDLLRAEDFETVVSDWVQPALVELERQHQEGNLTVAHVHAAERALKRRLGTLLDSLGTASEEGSSHPIVLVGQEQEGGSELAPLLFSIALRRHEVDVRYLGGGIDHESWTAAARQLRPRAVILAVATPAGVEAAQRLAEEVSGMNPPITVWLGGPGLAGAPRELRRRLPMDLRRATRVVVSHLRAGYGRATH